MEEMRGLPSLLALKEASETEKIASDITQVIHSHLIPNFTSCCC